MLELSPAALLASNPSSQKRVHRAVLGKNINLTFPLFIYDYLLLEVYKGLGIEFVFPYWYLTFFYFSFWIQFPLVAKWLEARES